MRTHCQAGCGNKTSRSSGHVFNGGGLPPGFLICGACYNAENTRLLKDCNVGGNTYSQFPFQWVASGSAAPAAFITRRLALEPGPIDPDWSSDCPHRVSLWERRQRAAR